MVEHSSDPARAVLSNPAMGGCAAAGGQVAATAFVLDINATSHFVQQHTFDCS